MIPSSKSFSFSLGKDDFVLDMWLMQEMQSCHELNLADSLQVRGPNHHFNLRLRVSRLTQYYAFDQIECVYGPS